MRVTELLSKLHDMDYDLEVLYRDSHPESFGPSNVESVSVEMCYGDMCVVLR